MSSKITLLSDDVANHIAAGEVIERPASVVKELVENSIDAGATQIDLEIGIGGTAYIRVKDDGEGMSREDAQLAFERHATSKIRCTQDISRISTMGFRGEALPSIASVAKLKLLTQTADEVVGTRVEIHGGEFVQVSDSGATPGTYIEVNDLFYKTPARLKFMKSPATEMSYINAMITDLALANPQIGFRVKNNGKEQVRVPAGNTLLQRVAGLFGRDLARDMVELRQNAASLELTGLIGLPSCYRANRNYQKVFVNARPVKDKVITHAIQHAYNTLVPKRRHPVVFLFLTLPVQLVDVNVHPAKTEIRFVNSQAIHGLIVKGIRQTLSQSLHSHSLPSFRASAEGYPDENPAGGVLASHNMPTEDSATHEAQIQELPFPEKPHHAESGSQSPRGLGVPDTDQTAPEYNGRASESRSVTVTRMKTAAELASFPSQGQLAQTLPSGPAVFARMQPIGQFDDTYILAQANRELYIIDQHAAHERIYYEKFKQQFQGKDVEIQQLLFPVSLDLSLREQAILEAHLEALRTYGFELEPFGGTTYVLKALPAVLAKADYKKLVYDIIDHLGESQKNEGVERKIDDVLMLMACHAAIRAHHRLQHAHMLALFQQLDALDLPYTCPHGRPTIIKISLTDLEKRFGRIM